MEKKLVEMERERVKPKAEGENEPTVPTGTQQLGPLTGSGVHMPPVSASFPCCQRLTLTDTDDPPHPSPTRPVNNNQRQACWLSALCGALVYPRLIYAASWRRKRFQSREAWIQCRTYRLSSSAKHNRMSQCLNPSCRIWGFILHSEKQLIAGGEAYPW